MVKIRLQREGKKKAPFYHIVVADSRSPREWLCGGGLQGNCKKQGEQAEDDVGQAQSDRLDGTGRKSQGERDAPGEDVGVLGCAALAVLGLFHPAGQMARRHFAYAKADEIIKTHKVPALPDGVEAEIHDILLEAEDKYGMNK